MCVSSFKYCADDGLCFCMICRMYRVLLACGESTSAKLILKKIPQDDSHIRFILKEYKRIHSKSDSQKMKKKKKKSKN